MWFNEYLAKARPLIIVNDAASQDKYGALSKQVQDDLIKYCGDKEINLMTPQLKKFFDIAGKGPLKTVVSGFMYLLHGTSLDGWRRNRLHIQLREIASLSSFKATSSSRMYICGVITKLLPQMLRTAASLISSPPYLSDLRPEVVCREVFTKKDPKRTGQFVRDDAHPFMLWTDVEQETGELLLARGQETGVYSLGDWEPLAPGSRRGATLPDLPHWHVRFSDKVFWGGPDTPVYPLHRDEKDADCFFTLWRGCKEFILIAPGERKHLNRILFPHINVWSDVLWITGKPKGMERAWKDAIFAGETLYMPGEFIHEVKNRCNGTMSICRRPWRASAARNIRREVDELWQEVEPERVVKESLVFSLLHRLGNFTVPHLTKKSFYNREIFIRQCKVSLPGRRFFKLTLHAR